jgi:hypothetical protein
MRLHTLQEMQDGARTAYCEFQATPEWRRALLALRQTRKSGQRQSR